MNPARGLPRAVLDSNVIFSRVVHELFGRLAGGERLLDLLWSDELLDEAARVLRERKLLSEPVAARWVGYLSDAFPEGRVDPSGLPSDVELATLTRDHGDEHVCALAVAGHADLLITFDRGYLAAALERFGVRVVDPDAWLSRAIEAEPPAFRRAIEAQAAAWERRRPGDELIAAFARAQLPEFARKASALVI
jgi:predicted nucleic acid-binding protein